MEVPQPSVAVAVPVPAGDVSPPHSTTIPAGHVITGPVVSTTIMVCAQDEVFPHSSIAVHVLVIVSVFPQPGITVSVKDTVVVPQPSVAVAVPVAAGVVSVPPPPVMVLVQSTLIITLVRLPISPPT